MHHLPQRHLPISLEALEARIAPAGVITATVAGGSLTLIGDVLANSLTIDSASAGEVTVTGLAGTQLFIGGVQVSDFTFSGFGGDLRVSLGDGADEIFLLSDLLPRNVILDGGKGDNNFSINSRVVEGSLSISGKGGADTVALNADQLVVGRDLNLFLGDGANEATSVGSAFNVLGKLNYTGGAGTDELFLNVTNLEVGGAATVRTGGGADVVDLRASSIQSYGSLTIATNPGAAAASTVSFTGGFLDVTGAFTVIGGAGNETVTVTATRLVVGGRASLALGAGTADSISIDTNRAFFMKELAIKTVGTTTTTIAADDLFLVGGAFTYLGGLQLDTLNLNVAGKIVGAATIDLGAGLGAGAQQQNLSLDGNGGTSLEIVGALTIKSAQANGFTVTNLKNMVANGAFNYLAGGSDDDLLIDNLDFNKGTAIITGAGADDFQFETGSIAGPSTAKGAFKLSLGAGADTATIGANSVNNQVTFNTLVFVDAGAGVDTTSILTRGNIFAGPLPVVLGSETAT